MYKGGEIENSARVHTSPRLKCTHKSKPRCTSARLRCTKKGNQKAFRLHAGPRLMRTNKSNAEVYKYKAEVYQGGEIKKFARVHTIPRRKRTHKCKAGCIILTARRMAKRAKVAPGKRPCRPESARRLPPPPFPPASLFPAPVPFSLFRAPPHPPPGPIPRRPRHPSAPALAPIPLRLTRPTFLRLQPIRLPPPRAPPTRALARPHARSPSSFRRLF